MKDILYTVKIWLTIHLECIEHELLLFSGSINDVFPLICLLCFFRPNSNISTTLAQYYMKFYPDIHGTRKIL